ncbi:hypothetical protein FOPG_18793 [Fusarium oxysporum f. sp. conglutinans race 2 54008]|nr:hypothetical protein FOPG_18793 [Fusarium oxysporum f. sp. conglutinans race 2 54008]
MRVNYSQNRISAQTQALTFEVPAGHYGTIVSQPNVRRVEGRVLDGCTYNLDKTDFVSDS